MRTLFTVLALAASLAACGDDENKAVDAAVKPIDAAVQIDAPPAVTLDCPTYCNQIQANCTGANAQYASMDHCLGSCAAFPVGKATDTTGNTLGCRTYHSGAPTKVDAALHCPHAGPGGDTLSAANPGFCSGGNVCEDFCNVEIKTCGSIDAPIPGGVITPRYQNAADCMTKCAAFPNKEQNYSLTARGDSLACRLYHVTNAASFTVKTPPDPAMTNNHCGHTASPATAVCTGAVQ